MAKAPAAPTTGADYSAIVITAEQSVAGVKDPELRRVAFEKILHELLGKGSVRAADGASTAVRSAKTKTPRGKRGPRAYLEELISDSFFKTPQTLPQIIEELGNRGHHIPRTSLSSPLQSICSAKLLRRQKSTTIRGRRSFQYSNW